MPGEAGRVLRLYLYHVLQTLSPHTVDTDAGVPARGLHGEGYRGHVFWDELFVLPYLNLHFPEVSRALLRYRHRRLPAACRASREAGRSGAMYPWQSGSDGREETPRLHLNPRSVHWLADRSRLQRHVGAAVAYNVWQYCEATGDTEFLHTEGAEMLLQIARFWDSGADFDTSLGRYRIRGVVGPDEYHDAYPGSAGPGLDDNAYTNVMAASVLERALRLVRDMPARRRQELSERLGITLDELERWNDVSRRLHIPFHDSVISQFDGYERLAELDWDAYRERYGDIRRLDRILEAEGDSVNRYRGVWPRVQPDTEHLREAGHGLVSHQAHDRRARRPLRARHDSRASREVQPRSDAHGSAMDVEPAARRDHRHRHHGVPRAHDVREGILRTILHVDLDAFYAAVEQRDDPKLRGKPVLVGGTVRRGVVASCSYEARTFGIKSAMPMAEAMRRCPHAIVVRHRMERYAEASHHFFAILGDYSPEVEGLSQRGHHRDRPKPNPPRSASHQSLPDTERCARVHG